MKEYIKNMTEDYVIYKENLILSQEENYKIQFLFKKNQMNL